MKIIVLAGGLGQRLWPVSRAKSPKHIQPILGAKTLLQQTVNRLMTKFSTSDIVIVTSQAYAPTVMAQLPGFPKKNILIEPQRKNTAAAIGLAAYAIAKNNPREIIISIASDHFIEGDSKFLRCLSAMEKVVKKKPSAVCLMGIKPTYPETGYGYIETGGAAKLVPGFKCFTIKKFIEKPQLPTAKKLAGKNRYYWNPSYFAWRVDRIQELFAKLIPKTHRLLLATTAGKTSAFKKINARAIEYGIMEKIKDDFYMIAADFGWADVGHWASVKEIHAKTGDTNVTLGLNHLLDTKGSLVYNYTNGVLTTVGVRDLLIVQTEDGTLVCHKDRAQDVKTLVEQMRKNHRLIKFL